MQIATGAALEDRQDTSYDNDDDDEGDDDDSDEEVMMMGPSHKKV